MIDRKLEPLVKRQMVKFLGELEDDDLVMFVLEHLKDHKGPQKLIEGLEPASDSYVCDRVITHNGSRCWRRKLLNLSSASGVKSSSKAWHTERDYIQNA